MNKSGFFESASDGFLSAPGDLVRRMVANSSDFIVTLGPDMVVTGLHLGAETLASEELDSLRNARFPTSLTSESLEKFEALIEGARAEDAPRWRQLNHVSATGDGLPVAYAATKLPDGTIMLLGRDKRESSALQQRLVQAQMTIEQDYERIRQVESRYRVLFETATDALVILAADTGRIVDANSAAARLVERDAMDLAGRGFAGHIEPSSQAQLSETLDEVRTKGGQKSVMLTLRGGKRQVWLDALLFRSVSDTLILCRLRIPTDVGGAHPFTDALVSLYDRAGDGVVFTDKDGKILRSNAAFQSMANVAVPERLTNESLATFLARPTVDLDVMSTNAERSGRLALYATSLRSEYGALIPVEISTTYLPDQQPPGFGFVIRDVTRLEASRQSNAAISSEAVEHVIELVGSTPLKELVRSTTDVVEKLCIETAIGLTNNNRAAAAEMLGLSRQSLYVKLRRFGLLEQDEDS